MRVATYNDLKIKLFHEGYADELNWADNIEPCESADSFFSEYAWVVINNRLKEQVARGLLRRIQNALASGHSAKSVLKHTGKSAAIDMMFKNRDMYFSQYCNAKNKLNYLNTLPFISEINAYHLAKNLGHDCCKPDRHLQRIAQLYNTTPEHMCKTLSQKTGDRIAMVDSVIWRAANLQWI